MMLEGKRLNEWKNEKKKKKGKKERRKKKKNKILPWLLYPAIAWKESTDFHFKKKKKKVSAWHSCGVHCWGFQLRMDNRLHVSWVSICTRVCVQPTQWSLGLSLHLIHKSAKKWSIVRQTVRTMFNNLKVHAILNLEMKYSSLNCPNQVWRTNCLPS